MKVLPWILVVILSVALLFSWLRPNGRHATALPPDTIIRIDTVRDSIPQPFIVRFDHWDTLYVPLYIVDTVQADSVLLPVPIPMERREYVTKDYRAVVSGYKPSLDVMEVFRKTNTVTVREKEKRWGIGPQVGIGYPGGWQVGIGISYHVWRW